MHNREWKKWTKIQGASAAVLVRRWLITLHSKQRNKAEKKVNGREKLNAVPLGGEICFGEDIKQKPKRRIPGT